MIHGLDKFREYFQDFKDNYVIIGGLASYLLLDDAGFDMARATKDIDLVLSVEALTDTFISQFWKFVKAGGYTCVRKSTGKRRFYRFTGIAPESPYRACRLQPWDERRLRGKIYCSLNLIPIQCVYEPNI